MLSLLPRNARGYKFSTPSRMEFITVHLMNNAKLLSHCDILHFYEPSFERKIKLTSAVYIYTEEMFTDTIQHVIH